jgi:hypothetical protein
MKKQLSAFFIILFSLFCISCDSILADKLNEKFNLTPPIYLSYKTDYGKAPSRVAITKGDVITEEMLPSVEYVNNNGSSYYYYDGQYYYYDDDEKTFTGWYYDDQYTQEVHVGDVIEGAVTLYAKWSDSYVYVYYNFYSDYGYYSHSDRIKVGTKLSSDNWYYPKYDFSSDYEFTGWYLDVEYQTSAEGYVVTSDIYLYAGVYQKYYYIDYVTSYYCDPLPQGAVRRGETLSSSELPTLYPYSSYDNMEFEGWYYGSACEDRANVGDEVTGNITLYANFVPRYYTITYETFGWATTPEDRILYKGEEFTSSYLPDLVPTYNSMRFLGWYFDSECEVYPANAGQIITSDTRLFAKWESIPSTNIVEYWLYDFDVSDECMILNEYTHLDDGGEYSTPSYFANEFYRQVGDDSAFYENYTFDGVEYCNVSVYRNLYCHTFVSAENLWKVLEKFPIFPDTSLFQNAVGVAINDVNPDMSVVASAIADHNRMQNYLRLDLSNCIELTEIPDNCFENEFYLKAIVLPESIQTIGEAAFKYCSALEDTGILWQNLTTIGESAYEYSGLKYIELHRCNSLTIIPKNAFAGCNSMQSALLPESIQTIGENAFQSCQNLSSIQIPRYVTQIGERAFSDCQQLTEIEIPNGVSTIPQYCFYNDASLKTIILPSTITLIEDLSFYNCPLENVYFYGTESQKDGITNYDTIISSVNWDCNYH